MRRRDVLKIVFGSLASFVALKPSSAQGNLFVSLCNIAISHEYGAITQYINHSGIVENGRIDEVLLSNMRDEVVHARGLTKILLKEGATPTVTPWPAATGKTVKVLIEEDIKGEEAAINLYQQILSLPESSRYRDEISKYLERERLHRKRLVGILHEIGKG